MRNLFILLMIVFYINPTSQVSAQSDDDFFMRDDTLTDLEGITKYDAFCPILEGDSVRYCGKNPCTGWIKDYYSGTDKLIHQGGYQYGQVAAAFTNYFFSGKIERSFVKKANGEFYTFNVFDSLSNPITQVEYFRKAVIKRKDYYRGGVLELDEVFDKKRSFVETQKYYYPNGKLYSELILVDKKKNIYSYRDFYNTGDLKSEGQKIRNPQINDYFFHGKWVFYDEQRKIIRQENYIKGVLID